MVGSTVEIHGGLASLCRVETLYLPGRAYVEFVQGNGFVAVSVDNLVAREEDFIRGWDPDSRFMSEEFGFVFSEERKFRSSAQNR